MRGLGFSLHGRSVQPFWLQWSFGMSKQQLIKALLEAVIFLLLQRRLPNLLND